MPSSVSFADTFSQREKAKESVAATVPMAAALSAAKRHSKHATGMFCSQREKAK